MDHRALLKGKTGRAERMSSGKSKWNLLEDMEIRYEPCFSSCADKTHHKTHAHQKVILVPVGLAAAPVSLATIRSS